MLEFLDNIDRQLFLFLNGLNLPWLDPIMYTLTDARYWMPLFLVVLGSLIYKFQWQSVTIILFLVLTIVCADQLSASLIKPLVGRLRPTHNPELSDVIHILNSYKGGRFSFVSSHAANAFAIATFLWLSLRQRIDWIWIMFVWAAFFSYTRIYLGVHYPGDILFGGLLGFLIGGTTYWLMIKIPMPNKLRFVQLAKRKS
jgi:undecaprenyl-diphosphatase